MNTTTTTLDSNLPSAISENNFDLQGLISLVCELFEVTKDDLCSQKRDQNRRWARWVIWKFCVESGKMKLVDAAKVFGCTYDHTTLLSARKKLREDLIQFNWLKVIVDKVTVEMGTKTDIV